MKQRKFVVFVVQRHLLFVVFAIILFGASPLLHATVLLYEQTSDGGLFNKHDITLETALPTDKHDRIGHWDGQKNQAWDWRSKRAYVGRVLFQGEPGTVVAVTNVGPYPTATNSNRDAPMANKFYWTQIASGGKASTDWTEYFLVLRPKGYTHANKQDDYTANTGVELTGTALTLGRGAGPSTEKATSGETGYDKDGNAGNYDGSNKYEYKYQYQAIFIDVTLIPNQLRTRKASKNWTDERGWVIKNYYPQEAWYETNILFSTGDGTTLQLMLQSKYESPPQLPPNPACIFTITELVSGYFPYSTLRQMHASASTALPVAKLNYSSQTCQAVIAICSDPSDSRSVGFGFRESPSSPIAIPHQLVYTCSVGSDCGGPVLIEYNNNYFYTAYNAVGPPSPMGGNLEGGHFLEGTVSLFVDPGATLPVAGRYRSNIYVLVERHQ